METSDTGVHWHTRNFENTGGSKSSYETGVSTPEEGHMPVMYSVDFSEITLLG